MTSRIFVDPVFFYPDHALASRNLDRRSGFMEGAGKWAVAVGLDTILPLPWIPLVDNHLDWHRASPDAGQALLFVSPGGKPPVTSFAVDREFWRYAKERRTRREGFGSSFDDLDAAGLVVPGDFESRVCDRDGLPIDRVTGAELVLRVSGIADCDGEYALLAADDPIKAQDIAEVRMGSLIEGTEETDPRLDSQ